MYKLKIITSTVREGRQGIKVAEWVKQEIDKFNKYDSELIDLFELDLPLSKEPKHPMLQQYVYDTTKNWSRIINSADAFIFVLAEYNHSYPAPLKNALDTISKEWGYKPAAIVSYGGIAGGTRAATDLIQVLTTLRIVPIADGLIFPLFFEKINKVSGQFEPGERADYSAKKMMDELYIWTKMLVDLRKEKELLND